MLILTAIVIAAIPTALYSFLIWWLDRYEKEPLPLLVAAFFWGAIPAIALAVLFQVVLAIPLEQTLLGPNVARLGLAPLVEEPLKALALVGLFLWARHEFDGPLDGIVYGSLIGFGFSMTENALYFVQYEDFNTLFWIRGVLFGMNHAFFTSIVGLSIGAVRYRPERTLKIMAFLGGLGAAILFHAIHNFLVFGARPLGLFLSWVVQFSGVIVIVAVAALAWRHERHWIETELDDEIRHGVISELDYADAASVPRRIHRQTQALLSGGWVRYRQVRLLHHLITELAFCKSKLRLADRFQTACQRDRLRDEIIALRAELDRDTRVWDSSA